MAKKAKKRKVLSYAKFVCPESVGSFIGYHGSLRESDYSDGITLTFGDCSRTVAWGLSKRHGLKKVQEAIKVLQRLEKEFTEELENV